MTVDVTDMLQTSKHNFQFRAKHQKYVKPCHKEEKYLSKMCQMISVLFAIVILMSALFLLRYYGSCYRLQHVKKQQQNTEEDKTCHKEQTCQKERNMPKKVKERRKKTEVKREKGPKLHAA